MEEREITFLFSFYIFLEESFLKTRNCEVFTWRCFLFLRLLLEKEEREEDGALRSL